MALLQVHTQRAIWTNATLLLLSNARSWVKVALSFSAGNRHMKKASLTLAIFNFYFFTICCGVVHGIDNIRVATASMTSSAVIYLLIAQKEGYFKGENLNVEILNMRGEIAAKIASAGEIDFFTQGLSGLTAAMRGVPVKILMIVEQKPAWDFVTQPNITTFAQLKGGTVGILSFEGSVAQATREMLRRNKLDPAKDVQLMVMGGNDMRFVSLKGKAIQATLLDPANSYRAKKEGFNVLASAGDYVANYLNSGIVAPQEKIRQSPEKIVRFMTASLKGYLFFLNRRDASISHMTDFLKAKDRDAVAAIYDSNVKAVSPDGTAAINVIEAVLEDAKRSTGIRKDFRAADFFDFSFLRKAAEQLKKSEWRP